MLTMRHLLCSIAESGVEVIVLSPLDVGCRVLREIDGLSFQHLNHLKPGSMNPWDDWLFYREIKSRFREIRPDLIFTFTIKPNIYGTYAAGRLGIPCIPTVTGLGYSYLVGGIRSRAAFAMYEWAFQSAHSVFFLNPSDLQIFVDQKIIDKGNRNSQLVPGAGVDLAYFSPRPRISSTPFTFLYVGRLLGHKGIREYVAAVKKLQEENISAAFEIVGPLDTHNPSAISPSEIADWISEGIIGYHGGVADVRPYYQSCDILVLPSYREGLSTVIVEALAMARPVIAADVPGCADALDASCGWLVPPQNTEALAQQMKLSMKSSSKILSEMGKNGRKRVESNFSTQQANQPYLKAIKRLVDSELRSVS